MLRYVPWLLPVVVAGCFTAPCDIACVLEQDGWIVSGWTPALPEAPAIDPTTTWVYEEGVIWQDPASSAWQLTSTSDGNNTTFHPIGLTEPFPIVLEDGLLYYGTVLRIEGRVLAVQEVGAPDPLLVIPTPDMVLVSVNGSHVLLESRENQTLVLLEGVCMDCTQAFAWISAEALGTQGSVERCVIAREGLYCMVSHAGSWSLMRTDLDFTASRKVTGGPGVGQFTIDEPWLLTSGQTGVWAYAAGQPDRNLTKKLGSFEWAATEGPWLVASFENHRAGGITVEAHRAGSACSFSLAHTWQQEASSLWGLAGRQLHVRVPASGPLMHLWSVDLHGAHEERCFVDGRSL